MPQTADDMPVEQHNGKQEEEVSHQFGAGGLLIEIKESHEKGYDRVQVNNNADGRRGHPYQRVQAQEQRDHGKEQRDYQDIGPEYTFCRQVMIAEGIIRQNDQGRDHQLHEQDIEFMQVFDPLLEYQVNGIQQGDHHGNGYICSGIISQEADAAHADQDRCPLQPRQMLFQYKESQQGSEYGAYHIGKSPRLNAHMVDRIDEREPVRGNEDAGTDNKLPCVFALCGGSITQVLPILAQAFPAEEQGDQHTDEQRGKDAVDQDLGRRIAPQVPQGNGEGPPDHAGANGCREIIETRVH